MLMALSLGLIAGYLLDPKPVPRGGGYQYIQTPASPAHIPSTPDSGLGMTYGGKLGGSGLGGGLILLFDDSRLSLGMEL